jgi:small subunit ribosomal protein S8
MNTTVIHSLINLKNSSILKKKVTTLHHNKFLLNILKILYREGFLVSYKVKLKIKKVDVYLKYSCDSIGFLDNLKLMSKPSKLNYINVLDVYRFTEKKKIFLLSTNTGLKTNFDCKKSNLGGKLLFVC